MYNIKEILESYFQREMYEDILDTINSYIKKGYGVDDKIIYYYIRALIMTRRYDEVYYFIKKYEKLASYLTKEYFAKLYYHCFHSKESERVLKENTEPLTDSLLLVKVLLRQGKMKEAKEALDEVIKTNKDVTQTIYINSYLRMINNYFRHGSYIEVEYENFVNNGNVLSPGHIIFLKEKPLSKALDVENNDPKIASRPYMIWKIEGDILYLFPVSSIHERKGYKLFKQKYLNSIGDRMIKQNLCKTTINNVLSVQDKVTEEDYSMVIRCLFSSLYHGSHEEKALSEKFLRETAGIPKKNDLIVYVEPIVKRHRIYFVYDITDDGYIVYEYDNHGGIVLDIRPQIISKETFIYNVITLHEDNIKDILAQINWTNEECEKIKLRKKERLEN